MHTARLTQTISDLGDLEVYVKCMRQVSVCVCVCVFLEGGTQSYSVIIVSTLSSLYMSQIYLLFSLVTFRAIQCALFSNTSPANYMKYGLISHEEGWFMTGNVANI